MLRWKTGDKHIAKFSFEVHACHVCGEDVYKKSIGCTRKIDAVFGQFYKYLLGTLSVGLHTLQIFERIQSETVWIGSIAEFVLQNSRLWDCFSCCAYRAMTLAAVFWSLGGRQSRISEYSRTPLWKPFHNLHTIWLTRQRALTLT